LEIYRSAQIDTGDLGNSMG